MEEGLHEVKRRGLVHVLFPGVYIKYTPSLLFRCVFQINLAPANCLAALVLWPFFPVPPARFSTYRAHGSSAMHSDHLHARKAC